MAVSLVQPFFVSNSCCARFISSCLFLAGEAAKNGGYLNLDEGVSNVVCYCQTCDNCFKRYITAR